jgi:hypothetical protein
MKICLTCASHRPNRLIRRVEFIGNNAYVVTLGGEIWKYESVSTPPYGTVALSA